jgi:hypothetical protein
VLYGEYTLATGLLRSGQVALCPRRVSDAVHHAHWRKTRLTAMPVHSAGLSDPEVTSKRYAVSLDWRDLVKRLSTGQKVVRDISSLGGPVDLVLETVPLWESKFVKTEGARDAMAVTLNGRSVRANKDRYLRWDVVYTPHTPGNAIHRLYHGDESGYVCEFSGVVAEDAVTSDLNYLFPDGWHDDGELLATYGKLVALQERPMWADNVRAVGRMAAWDEGASLTRVVRDVLNAVGGA